MSLLFVPIQYHETILTLLDYHLLILVVIVIATPRNSWPFFCKLDCSRYRRYD